MGFPFKLPLLLDGATGTNLMKLGMPRDVCPEKWILDNPDAIVRLQKEYINAGVQAIYAPTFGANRRRLRIYGLEDKVYDINTRLVKLTKSTVDSKSILVGGSISQCGISIINGDNNAFDQLIEVYREQIKAIKSAGADFIAAETMLGLADMRACVLCAKEEGIPIFVTMPVNNSGYTSYNTKFISASITLEAMGADAVGLNCCELTDEVVTLIEDVLPHVSIPFIIKPSINNSSSININTFAETMKKLLYRGVSIIGGCCGTTPEHIKALNEVVKGYKLNNTEYQVGADNMACTIDNEVFFIGDNIELTKPMKCSYDIEEDLINIEDERGNVILVEINSKDDALMLVNNSNVARMPICVRAHSADVLEYILRNFQGRLMVDTTTDIAHDTLNLISKKYGAIMY